MTVEILIRQQHKASRGQGSKNTTGTDCGQSSNITSMPGRAKGRGDKVTVNK